MPRLPRYSIPILLVVVLLIGGLFGWVRDEPLERQARLWMDAVNSQRQSSEGYLYLLGLDAQDEPLTIGRARQAEHRAWLDGDTVGDTTFEPAPVAQLSFGKINADCAGDLSRCFEPFRDGSHNLEALLLQGERLLARYHRAADFEDLRSRTAFDATSPLPSYSTLLHGNRLLAAQAYRLTQVGQSEQGRASLEYDLARWRKHLGEADTLIAKMVFARLIATDLGLLSALRQHGMIERPAAQAPLSPGERSLETAMGVEFVMLANSFEKLLDAPGEASELPVLSGWLLYKPNTTINAALPRYLHIADASKLSAPAFSRWLEQPAAEVQKDRRNPIGNLLLDIDGPDLSRNLALLHDLDARIALYNRLNRLEPRFSTTQALDAVEDGNPYEMGPARLAGEEQNRLCYDGPLKDDREWRCLPLRTGP